jgi:hypothetical protein
MFYIGAYYRNMPDYEKDARIRKLARKREDGSGYGFGERDLSFSYRSREKATQARARLKRAGFMVSKIDEGN